MVYENKLILSFGGLMLKISILDENDSIIYSAKLDNKINIYRQTQPVMDVENIYKEILNLFDDDVSIYLPYNEGEDFVIQFLNTRFLKIIGLSESSEIEGCLFSKTLLFPEYFLDILKDVYFNNKVHKIKGVICEDSNIILNYWESKYFKFHNKVLVITKDISKEKHAESTFFNLLDKTNYGFCLFDEEANIRFSNPYFSNLLAETKDFKNSFKDKVSLLDVSGEGIKTFKGLIQGILKNKFYSLQGTLLYHSNSGEDYIFNIGAYKYYNEKNRVQITFFDITKEYYENEKNKLIEENLNIMGNISKGALLFNFYDKNNKRIFYYSDEFYNIIERPPKKEDGFRNVYCDYFTGDNAEYLDFDEFFNYKEKNINTLRTIKTAKGNIKYVRSFIKIDPDKKSIIAYIQDITNEEIMNRKLKEELSYSADLVENLNILSSLSKAGHSYVKDNIVQYNDEIYNLLEKEPEEEDGLRYLVDEAVINEDKHIMHENYSKLSPSNPHTNFKLRIETFKGNIKWVEYYIFVKYSDEGKIIKEVGFFRDITEEVNNYQELLDKTDKALKLQNNLDLVESIAETQIVSEENNKFFYKKVFKEHLLSLGVNINDNELFIKNILLDENRYVFEEFLNNITKDNPSGVIVCPILIKDELKYVRCYLKAVYEGETLKKRIYLLQNITKEKLYENQLNNVLKDKVKLLSVKEILLNEIHHRVKNNLQILSSLLQLEGRFEDKTPYEIIQSTKKRINSMALIHEKSYSYDKLFVVKLKPFIKENMDDLLDLFDNSVEVILDIDEDAELLAEILNPLSLIINELCINAIKFAFKDNQENKQIILNYYEYSDKGVFIVYDNGVGLAEDIDIYDDSYLSFSLINALAIQIDAEFKLIDYSSSKFKIEFPLDQKSVNLSVDKIKN